ncbi:MAG: acetoin utilization protein AcuC [Rhodospirillaceae bacterium]|nr:acetoin utilization protein AcuC [Rhodospirillaceae bacterium]
MMPKPRFIGSEIYRHSRYGGKHPLAIPRVSLAIDLCRELGWLPGAQYVDSPVATVEQLTRFHDPDYVAAVRQCERDGRATPEQRARFNLGVNGNPVFGEVFRRPATAAGATLHAIGLLEKGGTVFSPAGGTHHGLKDRASGFCFFNDPVLGVLAALDRGATRVAYIDIDAHHCDGVEIALGDDPRVMILSVHEAGRWPRTGNASDPPRHLHNYPVVSGFGDNEFELLMNSEILPAVSAFDPQLLVLQCGADALADDPMSGLALTNASHARTAAAAMPLAPRLLVTGGGGYNPWATARCWTRVWGVLNGLEAERPINTEAQTVLRAVTWSHSRGRNPPERWFASIADEAD